MQKAFNDQTKKFEWTLVKWWEKTIYVFGCIYSIFLAAAFLVGFLEGLSGL